jgi:SMC interacting uncharacterized protein involved in chromosome segregation
MTDHETNDFRRRMNDFEHKTDDFLKFAEKLSLRVVSLEDKVKKLEEERNEIRVKLGINLSNFEENGNGLLGRMKRAEVKLENFNLSSAIKWLVTIASAWAAGAYLFSGLIKFTIGRLS